MDVPASKVHPMWSGHDVPRFSVPRKVTSECFGTERSFMLSLLPIDPDCSVMSIPKKFSVSQITRCPRTRLRIGPRLSLNRAHMPEYCS